jgi:hypothetical protein
MKFFDWWIENIWTILFSLYFLSSVLDISGILFSVKHTDTETKVSIETPMNKEKSKDTNATPSTPQAEDGPKASW